uniref:OmpA-like domain-containing protein n=1 Tax=Steinernema glaseri TaxID=37863 RepID=A0A1I7Y643_9BILA
MSTSTTSTERKALGLRLAPWLGCLAMIGLLILATTQWNEWTSNRRIQSTQNAYVKSDFAVLSAKVSGYVKALPLGDYEQARLVKEGALSRQGYENAQADLDEAISQGEAATAQVELAKNSLKVLQGQRAIRTADLKSAEAALESARRNLGYTRIVAPFDGVLNKRHVQLACVNWHGCRVWHIRFSARRNQLALGLLAHCFCGAIDCVAGLEGHAIGSSRPAATAKRGLGGLVWGRAACRGCNRAWHAQTKLLCQSDGPGQSQYSYLSDDCLPVRCTDDANVLADSQLSDADGRLEAAASRRRHLDSSVGESTMLIGLIAAFVTNLNPQHGVALGVYVPIARVFTPVAAATLVSTWLRMAGDISRSSLSSHLVEGDPLVMERASAGGSTDQRLQPGVLVQFAGLVSGCAAAFFATQSHRASLCPVCLWTLACTALLASTSAWAVDGSASVQEQVYSKSRAQVVQELEQAREQGLISVAAHGYPNVPRGPVKTRAQVVQELQEAQQAGLLDFADDEYPVLPADGTHKTRQQVVQELEQARKQGRL